MGKKSIKTDPEMAQMTYLADKNIKIVIFIVFYAFQNLREKFN